MKSYENQIVFVELSEFLNFTLGNQISLNGLLYLIKGL